MAPEDKHKSGPPLTTYGRGHSWSCSHHSEEGARRRGPSRIVDRRGSEDRLVDRRSRPTGSEDRPGSEEEDVPTTRRPCSEEEACSEDGPARTRRTSRIVDDGPARTRRTSPYTKLGRPARRRGRRRTPPELFGRANGARRVPRRRTPRGAQRPQNYSAERPTRPQNKLVRTNARRVPRRKTPRGAQTRPRNKISRRVAMAALPPDEDLAHHVDRSGVRSCTTTSTGQDASYDIL